ncbi:hypothetical protein Hypma_007232 [Hypsizygus marmoreus]|uniref:BHLH domain-containing protein n=1 Tax=Hypsizygus marmoreus TaxID=39966 RepID=A0A369KC23_HYPMA|nr:hypothetical protein Hypma_007232 [Hypsizygus marmoreus]
MDFFVPSPSSSGSESRSSYSPRLMSSDLGLDPSDPLNLLLHNTSQTHDSQSGNSSMDDSSQEGSSPPDWSQLSALWPDQDLGTHIKSYPEVMNFSDLTALPMDIDFNPSISIEPSALHFNPIKYNINANYSYDGVIPSYTDDLLTTQFPFTFQSPYDSTTSSNGSPLLSALGHRRLSITSSSSSSGASLSPVPESAPSPPTVRDAVDFTTAITMDTKPIFSNDPAAELAERVRRSAGVMLALPMSAQLQALENQQAMLSAPNASPTVAPKLPIPRLPRHVSQSVGSASSASSAASTPPLSTPSPPPASAQETPSMSQLPLPRPKTSHTTIERRYRTNLNSCIWSVRMAVPALRVVEDREGGKKRAPNKVLVSSDPLKLEGADGSVDIVDERGFIDGVKVARKCSKANILRKAVEYIRVLKKREHRLTAEQSGLKSLISGLVGGPALLREWEREWREQFGGPEKDEVEGEMEEGDDDDSDIEQDDAEEEAGRKRKRGKVAAPSTAPVMKQEKEKKEKKPPMETNGVFPEKRKRGRPRKVIPVVPPVPAVVQDQIMDSAPMAAHGQTEQGQSPQQYLLATFALFSFFNSPLTSSSSSDPSHVHTGTVLNGPTVVVDGQGSWGFTEYVQVFHLAVSVLVLLSFISTWVGFGLGGSGSLRSWIRGVRKEKKTKAEWVKAGEECVLAGTKQDVPLSTRFQIYHQISSWSGAGVSEMATAAMTLYGTGGILAGLARIKARAVWAATKAKVHARAPGTSINVYERMVLDGVSLDAAIERFGDAVEEKGSSPIQVLASALVKERVRKHLGLLFIGSVCGSVDDEAVREVTEQEIVERQQTITAAKELGGHVGDLGRKLERAWKATADCYDDIREGEEAGINGEIMSLFTALVLYRRVFSSIGNGASALLSPPPSPGREDTSDAGVLRRALGSRAFEEWEALEDARDRAVDMVVELERRSVGLD